MTIIFYQLSTYIQTLNLGTWSIRVRTLNFYTPKYEFGYIGHIHRHLFGDKLTTWLVFTSPNEAKVIIYYL